ncbi:polysaccharide deacetylase family protein [Clostridium saccharoperbutylacetonicum]|uniref:polysaccharide deacetylase family protein n=1 Tax=Clostridium saccharoperbutylacetonicum TaxID=36745 RepID=UPI000983FDED|nr:polysaccharide deacetylase family protein [Clostridium saccharoperbutylacetonicum]AQR94158.1 poly-beta-1,6-N-acetyl-D-glucosamine N-deacetylase precursor [Clostridium saccharoperbutylacetonicum]NSB29858.1 peptidoglycan/xylan/chitin deacetylase (PgdA/CDA1 family) [Clostridium saccharoperbutylacetonicum]
MKKIIISIIGIAIIMSAFTFNANAATSVKIPVLMYHRIETNSNVNDTWQIGLNEFKQEMKYLKDNGYTTLTNDQFYNIITKKASMPVKPILLTFDGATIDFYNNAYPILKQYGFNATEYVVTDQIGTSWGSSSDTIRIMNENQLKTVANNKIELENHSTTHGHIANLSTAELTKRVSGATTKLKTLTSKPVEYFAYPFGESSNNFVNVLKSLNVKMAFKVGGGMATDSSDLMNMPRIAIVNTDNITTFTKKITTGN